jgi:DNA adenine methylase
VWTALGDVTHYVEPFCGSCAVLLRRPHPCNRTYYSETVNDADGLLVNAIRSIQIAPEATAEFASEMVVEADLMARHLAILRWKKDRELEKLMAEPTYCDPLIAGWWLWGLSCWIGGGWCDGSGPWIVGKDGRITRQAQGVSRRRPHVSDNGNGVNHPGTREPGVAPGTPDRPWEESDFHPQTMPELRRWFAFLSARLRHVRILNGDWKRACTTGVLHTLTVRQGKSPVGVFLDPPYSMNERDARLYAHDTAGIAEECRKWCLKNGGNPKNRIVLAGFSGEGHEELEQHGWRVIEWFKEGFLKGGMGNQARKYNAVEGWDGGDAEVTHQQGRERLWLSPHCLYEDDNQPLYTVMESDND